MQRTSRHNPGAPASTAVDQGQLQAELQQKTCSLVAVQRNYDVLSRVMQQKQGDYDALKKQHDEESRRALGLSIKLEDALARAQRAEAGAAKLRMVEEQLAAVEKQNVKLNTDVEILTAQLSSSTAKVKSLQKASEESEFKVASVKREANTWHNSVAAAQEESRRALERLDLAKGEIAALKKELINSRAASASSAQQRQAAEAHASQLELMLQNRDEQILALKGTIRSLQDDLHDSDSTCKAMQVTLVASKQQCLVAEEQAQSLCRSLSLASESQRAAERASRVLEESLAAAQATVKEKDAKISQMKYLLEDAEDRYQALLTRGMEETEGLARLKMQLAQAKALASAAQEDLDKARAAHDLGLEGARLATRAAEQHAAEAMARTAEARRAHTAFLESMVSKVDTSLHSVSVLQAEAGRILGDLNDTQERSLHVLACRLQKMETQWTGIEDVITVIDSTMTSLSAALDKQAFKKVSAADAAQERTVALEGLLAAERAAKAALIKEKQQVEAGHLAAIEVLQHSLDERLESERQRLNLKLTTVESGVMRLKQACEADHAEALRMFELEKQKMSKVMDEARSKVAMKDQKIAELIKELGSAGEQEIGALSTRHMEEMERLKILHSKDIAKHKDMTKAIQANVSAAWDTGHQLFQDMDLLSRHLAKMGWEVQQLNKGALPAKSAEDGTGAELAKACIGLRLHFSHLTEAVQECVRRASMPPPPPPPPPPPKQTADWAALAKELRMTVQKLVHVEDALASNCTCMLCLEVLKQPITCVPGGHTYCKSCFEARNYHCEECGTQASQTVANAALEAICSKFEFKQQALRAIEKAVTKASTS